MRGRPYFMVAGVLWLASSCVTDHDQLAKTGGDGSQTSAGASQGGVGGSVPMLDSATSAGGTFGGTMTTGPMFEFDDDGPDELTLIHGQVDAERIAFCFAPVENGVAGDPAGDPLPEGGLEFGESVTTRSPGGLSFEDDSIVPIVLAGDLASVEGEDCRGALDQATWVDSTPGAGGAAGASSFAEGLVAMALPQLVSGSLTLGRRYLLAVVGCMTSPLGVDGYADLCGPPPSSNTPTLGPVLVTASRETRFDRMGMQVLHASPGSEELTLDVVSSPVGDSLPTRIASDLVFGELYPPTPNLNVSAEQFGVDTSGSVHVFQNGARVHQVSWAELMQQAGLDALGDGESYALVLLGPRAGTAEGGGFQGTRLTLIHTTEADD